MTQYSLPHVIRDNLEQNILRDFDLKSLVQASESVSLRYRREGSKQNFQIQNEVEALSYIVARLPATYASNTRVLSEIQNIASDFSPSTVLDIGAGPATASLAAQHIFSSLQSYTLVEPNTHLRRAGERLIAPYLNKADWQSASIENFKTEKQFDLVLSSYVLNEISSQNFNNHLDKLWSACGGVMCIIEPGTPHGASVIGQVRDWALSQNINILAPCPHEHICPLKNMDARWCHFSVRTERSKLHKHLKGGDAGFEDEKFSYLVLSRSPTLKPSYRIIGHPTGTKPREVQVCGKNGAETLKISKSHPLHNVTKKLEWGDGFND